MERKQCTKCKQEYPNTLEYFSIDKYKRPGSWCRECKKKSDQARRVSGKKDFDEIAFRIELGQLLGKVIVTMRKEENYCRENEILLDVYRATMETLHTRRRVRCERQCK